MKKKENREKKRRKIKRRKKVLNSQNSFSNISILYQEEIIFLYSEINT